MKHETIIPPIEWDMIVTFRPPERLYAVSSFFFRPSISRSILQEWYKQKKLKGLENYNFK